MNKIPYEIEFVSSKGKYINWIRFSTNLKDAVNSALDAYVEEYNETPRNIQVNETCIGDLSD